MRSLTESPMPFLLSGLVLGVIIGVLLVTRPPAPPKPGAVRPVPDTESEPTPLRAVGSSRKAS